MPRLGYLAVALAAVLWAVGGNVARALADRGASVVELTEARAWIAVAGTGALLLRRTRPRPAGAVRASWRSLVVVVPFGLALASANLTYYLAVSLLPVAVAIVIQYTAPGLVVLWTSLVEKRRPSRRVTGALLLVLAGVVLLSRFRLGSGIAGGLDPAGLAAAAGSSFAFAAYMLLGERVGRRFGPERSVFYGFVVAGAAWGIVQGMRGAPRTLLQPSLLPGILYLGVFATIVPFFLFLWGLQKVEASRAGIVSTLEPLTAALIAYVWLGQALSASQLAGAAMVIGGIGIVQTEQPAAPEVLAERAVAE